MGTIRTDGTGWQEYAEQLRIENDMLMSQLSNERGKILVLEGDIDELKQAAQSDQLVIQRLRRERDEFAAIAENAQAKLLRLNQLAASRAGRVPR